MTSAWRANAEIRRVFDTPKPPIDWECVAVWGVIFTFALLELSVAGYWLFRLADVVLEKLARLIP